MIHQVHDIPLKDIIKELMRVHGNFRHITGDEDSKKILSEMSSSCIGTSLHTDDCYHIDADNRANAFTECHGMKIHYNEEEIKDGETIWEFDKVFATSIVLEVIQEILNEKKGVQQLELNLF
jgi:hypothetical protein